MARSSSVGASASLILTLPVRDQGDRSRCVTETTDARWAGRKRPAHLSNLWSSQADRDAYRDAAIPTIGLLRGVPPMEPKKGELKEKTPPSEATVQ